MHLSLTAVRLGPAGHTRPAGLTGPIPGGSTGPHGRARQARPARPDSRALRRVAPALLLSAALGLAGGCSQSQQSAGAVLPPGPTVTKTLVTLDLEGVEDCAGLAGAVLPLWDSLGDLTAEEANQLDDAVVTEIGTYLAGIEQRRLAMGCDAERWKRDTCAALAGTSNAIATRFSAASC